MKNLGTTHKDFLRPEDDRPEKGPIYAVNTSSARIVFEKRDNIPAVNFGPSGTPDSVRQVDIKILDVVEFLKLWSNGTLAVSNNRKVAQTYTSLEVDRKEAKEEKNNKIIESIESRDDSNDYVVETSGKGTPVVKKNTRANSTTKKESVAPVEDSNKQDSK